MMYLKGLGDHFISSSTNSHTYQPRSKMEKSRSFPEYKSVFGCQNGPNPYSFNGPSRNDHGFGASNDPEMKRKKRIAAYNMFSTEGKVKASVRDGFRWIKTKINDIRYNL